jgi:hypothetical protein
MPGDQGPVWEPDREPRQTRIKMFTTLKHTQKRSEIHWSFRQCTIVDEHGMITGKGEYFSNYKDRHRSGVLIAARKFKHLHFSLLTRKRPLKSKKSPPL